MRGDVDEIGQLASRFICLRQRWEEMKAIFKMGFTAIIIYGLIVLGMYVFQEDFIFYPSKLSVEALSQLESVQDVDDVEITTSDGTNLKGWFIPNKDKMMHGLIIYFGGNAEEVSWLTEDMKQFKGWSVLLMNYRGYGQSEGLPSEEALFGDALEVYDQFSNQYSPGRVVVMGRSLGTGVATYVAANRQTNGVILISPYDSIASVAKEHFSFLPVDSLLTHKFNSLSRANKIHVPLKILIANNDTTIPPWHSRKLSTNWGGPVDSTIIKGEDHNSISSNPEYWKSIRAFLDSLKG